jgi:hypothetical protein
MTKKAVRHNVFKVVGRGSTITKRAYTIVMKVQELAQKVQEVLLSRSSNVSKAINNAKMSATELYTQQLLLRQYLIAVSRKRREWFNTKDLLAKQSKKRRVFARDLFKHRKRKGADRAYVRRHIEGQAQPATIQRKQVDKDEGFTTTSTKVHRYVAVRPKNLVRFRISLKYTSDTKRKLYHRYERFQRRARRTNIRKILVEEEGRSSARVSSEQKRAAKKDFLNEVTGWLDGI